MRKIHVTWQFFEASSSHGDFFEKTKKPVFREGQMGVCVVSFFVWPGDETQINKYTNKYTVTRVIFHSETENDTRKKPFH